MSEQAEEQWASVVGYEGLYEVSTLGSVRSTVVRSRNGHESHRKDGRVLRQYSRSVRYKYVCLCKNGVQKNHRVHVLVAHAFLGPRPPEHHVDHINFNRHDNRLENLRYLLGVLNQRRYVERVRDGGSNVARLWCTSKLEKHGPEKISRMLVTKSILDVAQELGVGSSSVRRYARSMGIRSPRSRGQRLS